MKSSREWTVGAPAGYCWGGSFLPIWQQDHNHQTQYPHRPTTTHSTHTGPQPHTVATQAHNHTQYPQRQPQPPVHQSTRLTHTPITRLTHSLDVETAECDYNQIYYTVGTWDYNLKRGNMLRIFINPVHSTPSPSKCDLAIISGVWWAALAKDTSGKMSLPDNLHRTCATAITFGILKSVWKPQMI